MPDQRTILANMKVAANRLKEIGTGVRISRVLGNRVLVKTVVPHTELDEVEKRGSIIVPAHLKKDYTPMPTTGMVLAVGEGVETRTEFKLEDGSWVTEDNIRGAYTHGMREVKHIAEGEMVMFPRVAGMDFSISGEDLRIIHVNDILAVLEDTDDSVVSVRREDVYEGTGT